MERRFGGHGMSADLSAQLRKFADDELLALYPLERALLREAAAALDTLAEQHARLWTPAQVDEAIALERAAREAAERRLEELTAAPITMLHDPDAVPSQDAWRATANFLVAERDAAVRRLEHAEQALRYIFAAYLPTETCNGPRDCGGTTLGCRVCAPDAKLDAARAALAAAATPPPHSETRPLDEVLAEIDAEEDAAAAAATPPLTEPGESQPGTQLGDQGREFQPLDQPGSVSGVSAVSRQNERTPG